MKVKFLLIVVLITFYSCQNATENESAIRSESELLDMIHRWSNSDSLKNTEIRINYTHALNEFITHYPDNPEHENFLFISAQNDVNQKDFTHAAEKYGRFTELYPKSRSHPDAVFAAGFLYNNELFNLDSAKKYYEIFILSYPDHILNEAAKSELKYLGKSPEEMLNDLTQNPDSVDHHSGPIHSSH